MGGVNAEQPISAAGLTIQPGTQALRLPGTGDKVFLFNGVLSIDGDGTRYASELRGHNITLFSGHIGVINSINIDKGTILGMFTRLGAKNGDINLKRTRNEGDVYRAGPGNIVFESSESGYQNVGTLDLAEHAGTITLKGKATNGSDLARGTVRAVNGSVIFDNPGVIANSTTSSVYAKTCTFRAGANEGQLQITGSATFLPDTMSGNLKNGIVSLEVSGSNVKFEGCDNLGAIQPGGSIVASDATVFATFTDSRKTGKSSINNGLVISATTYFKKFSSNGSQGDIARAAGSRATISVYFSDLSRNHGIVRADRIDFINTAKNEKTGTVSATVPGVFFKDKSVNLGNVTARFTFEGDSSNAIGGIARHESLSIFPEYQVSHFRGDSINHGFVSSCPVSAQLNYDLMAPYKPGGNMAVNCCERSEFGSGANFVHFSENSKNRGKAEGCIKLFDQFINYNIVQGKVAILATGAINEKDAEILGDITVTGAFTNNGILDGKVRFGGNSTNSSTGKIQARTCFGDVVFTDEANTFGEIEGSLLEALYGSFGRPLDEQQRAPLFRGNSVVEQGASITNIMEKKDIVFVENAKNKAELDARLSLWFEGPGVTNESQNLKAWSLYVDRAENSVDAECNANLARNMQESAWLIDSLRPGRQVVPSWQTGGEDGMQWNLPAKPKNSAYDELVNYERKLDREAALATEVENELRQDFGGPPSAFFFENSSNKGKVHKGLFKNSKNSSVVDGKAYFENSSAVFGSEVEGILAYNSDISGTVNGQYARFIGSVSRADVTAGSTPLFEAGSVNRGTVHSHTEFTSSVNGYDGVVDGNAWFSDGGGNEGTVTGSADFDQASNGTQYGGSSAYVGVNATFTGGGGPTGDIVDFFSSSVNYGFVAGDASFSSGALNYGAIDCAAYYFMGGRVQGNATFTGGSYNGLCPSLEVSTDYCGSGDPGGTPSRAIIYAAVYGNASFDGEGAKYGSCSFVVGNVSCPTCNEPDFPDNPPPDNPLIP